MPPLKREVARSAGGISAQSTFRKNSFHAQPNQTQQGSHAPANGVWLLFLHTRPGKRISCTKNGRCVYETLACGDLCGGAFWDALACAGGLCRRRTGDPGGSLCADGDGDRDAFAGIPQRRPAGVRRNGKADDCLSGGGAGGAGELDGGHRPHGDRCGHRHKGCCDLAHRRGRDDGGRPAERADRGERQRCRCCACRGCGRRCGDLCHGHERPCL